MRCPKCGEEIYEGDSFCTACGMRVVQPAKSGYPSGNFKTPKAYNSNAPKNKTVIIIGLLLVVIAASVIFFAVRGKGDNITGTWQAVEDPDSYIELYNTGYGVACGLWNGSRENMKWTFTEGTLTMIPEDTLRYSTVTTEIKLNGNRMTMLNSSGFAVEFEKVSK